MPSASPPIIAVILAACSLAALVWAWRKGDNQTWYWRVSCALAVLLPMAGLLRLHDGFGYDWYNHAWMIGYFGEYFRQHHQLPAVFNSTQAIGMPQPIFYAFLVYPIAGIVSSLIGAALALRLTLIAATGLQFASVLTAARATTKERYLPAVLALSSICSTYALTNLYNRAAITEFLAVSFLTSAVCLGLAAFYQERPVFLWLAGLLLALMIGCHPSTALLGSLFVALLAIAVAASGRRTDAQFRWVTVATLCLIMVAAAPWVYATLRFRADLGIVGAYHDLDLMSGRTDSLVGRFVPFPTASLWPGRTDGLPFIEAPLDGVPVLLLAFNVLLLLFGRTSRQPGATPNAGAVAVAAVSIVWFVLATLVSVSRAGADFARPFAPYVQFCYRFVSYANLGVLAAVIATTALASARGLYARAHRATMIVITAGFALTFAAAVVKLGHAAAVADTRRDPQYAFTGSRDALITEARADAAGDYAAIRHLPQLAPGMIHAALHAEFAPGTAGGSFAEVPPLAVDCDQNQWVITNVVAFPWNRISVDGREPTAMLPNRWRWAVKLPKGHHVLRWEWSPDSTWVALSRASWIALAAALVGTIGFSARGRKKTAAKGVAEASCP